MQSLLSKTRTVSKKSMTRFDYDEERTLVIGLSRRHVLFVVTTQRGENVCRIISARKATRDEENRYYAGDREVW